MNPIRILMWSLSRIKEETLTPAMRGQWEQFNGEIFASEERGRGLDWTGCRWVSAGWLVVEDVDGRGRPNAVVDSTTTALDKGMRWRWVFDELIGLGVVIGRWHWWWWWLWLVLMRDLCMGLKKMMRRWMELMWEWKRWWRRCKLYSVQRNMTFLRAESWVLDLWLWYHVTIVEERKKLDWLLWW